MHRELRILTGFRARPIGRAAPLRLRLAARDEGSGSGAVSEPLQRRSARVGSVIKKRRKKMRKHKKKKLLKRSRHKRK
jgi:hypothetical protein